MHRWCNHWALSKVAVPHCFCFQELASDNINRDNPNPGITSRLFRIRNIKDSIGHHCRVIVDLRQDNPNPEVTSLRKAHHGISKWHAALWKEEENTVIQLVEADHARICSGERTLWVKIDSEWRLRRAPRRNIRVQNSCDTCGLELSTTLSGHFARSNDSTFILPVDNNTENAVAKILFIRLLLAALGCALLLQKAGRHYRGETRHGTSEIANARGG